MRIDLSSVEKVESAAKLGAVEALFELGMMYSTGREVEADLITAHKWFNLAALQGNEDAKKYRMELAREMAKDEVAEAQRMARAWLKQE
ncbi:MAG: hypothetical protein AAF228_04290 [Pseudomonadota bacterium]